MSLNLLYSVILIYLFSIHLNIIPSLKLRSDSTVSCLIIYCALLIPFIFITSCAKFKRYCSIYTLIFMGILFNLDYDYEKFNYEFNNNVHEESVHEESVHEESVHEESVHEESVREEQFIENFLNDTNLQNNKCKYKEEKLCLNITKESLDTIQKNVFDSNNDDIFPNETLDSNVNIQGYFKDISGYSF